MMAKLPVQNSRRNVEAIKSEILKLKVIQSDWEAHVRGCPYRVIEIAGDESLDKLANAILDSFDFMKDHLYGFYDNLKRWEKANERYELDDISSRLLHKVRIETVFKEDKKKMLFLYDYGDEWRFIVQRIGTAKKVIGETYPRVVESYGESRDQYPEFDDEGY